MIIKYCKKCVMPNTKPNMFFIDDVCPACYYHEKYKSNKINWKSREKEFRKLIRDIKQKKSENFDAVVGVSGGKDSISQVHYLLKSGLRVLAVNVDYGLKTAIGKKNLDIIPSMGASLIIYRPNLKIHKKILKISFEKYGDPDLMSHCLLYAIPIRMAVKFRIPLVFLGENSALEYSGDDKYDPKKISTKWFKKYAANNGITPKIFSKKHNIPYKYMINYDLPSAQNLNKILCVFCSYYFKWDSLKNLRIAKKYGFLSLKKNGEGTFRKYVGIDEKINRIHQYLKFLKFGYGRATDHACEDIRNKRLTRKKAIQLIKKFDRVNISKYYYKEFIDLINISSNDFFKTLNKYTNKKIHYLIKNIK